ncbi:hypothetical protein [Dyella ginsengisoli]
MIDAKYDHVLVPFARLMAKELHANADKGDRPGWLSMTPSMAMLELYYHVAKLQKAVKDGDMAGVREYAADVGNMSMMVLDVCGGLVTFSGDPNAPAIAGIKTMVDRFLSWRRPDAFRPDAGVSFTRPDNPAWWPVGTNLLDADQAEQMVRYMLGADAEVATCPAKSA